MGMPWESSQGLCVPRSGWKGSCLNNHFCLLCNLFFSPKRQWQGIGKPEKESPSLSLEKDSCGFRRLDMNCQGKVAHLSKLDVFGLSFKGPNPTSSQDGGKAPQNPFWILDFGFWIFGFFWIRLLVAETWSHILVQDRSRWKGIVRKTPTHV